MTTHSHKYNLPSAMKTILNDTATTKNPTSLKKSFRATLNGCTRAIEPTTTAVMKLAAPISSPTAKLPLCECMAANVEKTSGLPFPKAKKVTPAILSLIPRLVEIVLRLGEKKSLAAIPMVMNSTLNQRAKIMKARGLT